MKKICNQIILLLFVAVLFAVPLASVCLPRETVSVYENRTLATFPELTLQTLVDGSFVAGLEDYMTDHIVGRNRMLEAYVRLNRSVLGKPIVNGIYESEQGTLLDHLPYDQYEEAAVCEAMEHKISELTALNDLVTSYGGTFVFCGVSEQRRDRYDQYPDYLNPGTQTIDRAEQLLFDGLAQADIPAISMYEVFAQNGGQDGYYSKLDHHYTFAGAHLTYETILETINQTRKDPLPILRTEDLIFHEEPGAFYGSYNRKIFNLQETQEKLTWAEPKEPIPFTRTDNGTAVEPTIFTPREGNASYGSYMDGDIAETVLDTNRDELPSILIFGDSFTNPVEGLLYYSFDELRALDLRYYDQMTLFDYIERHQPDYVVALRDRMQYHQTAGNGTYR